MAWLLLIAGTACDEAGRLPHGYSLDAAEDPPDTAVPARDTLSSDAPEIDRVDTPDGEIDANPAPDDASPEDATTDLNDASDLSDASDIADTPDAADTADPNRPELTTEPLRLTRLTDSPVAWVAAPDPTRTLVLTDGDLVVLTATGSTSLGPVAAPRSAVTLADGRLLLATDTTLLIEDDGALVPSPLASVFGAPALGLATEADTLWVTTADALHHIAALTLRTVTTPGIHLGTPLVATGVSPATGKALWLASPDGIIAIAPSASDFDAWLTSPLFADALATDAAGRTWALASGRVHRRDAGADNTWTPLSFAASPHTLLAHPDSPHVWLLADGLTIHESNGSWARLDAPLPAATATAISPDGTLLIGTADGLFALPPGRLISLAGLAPGARLEAPTDLEIRVSDPHLATVDARLDGTPIPATLEGEGASSNFRLTLDPAPLVRGSHRLDIDVRYSDDATHLSATLPFDVYYVTWQDEIAPLYSARCATCHNAVAGASTAVLTTPDAWKNRIDCILCRVDRNSEECQACEDFASPMPPAGPLSDLAVDHLRRWRDDGFR